MTKNFPYLTHPIIISALFLTAINDHYLKDQFHNFLTGKISDFSGLFYFPLLLYGLSEFIKSPQQVHNTLSIKKVISLIFITDFLFIVAKFTDMRLVLIQFFNLKIVEDYSDLTALSVNVLTFAFAKKFFIKPGLK